MAYDNNTDYMALMNAASAKGDVAAYNAAKASREEKIANANSQQLKDWGVSAADANKAGYNTAMSNVAAQQAAIAQQQAALKQAQINAAMGKLANARATALGNIDTQLNNTTSALSKAQTSALSNLNTQATKIAPTYYNMRNSASAQSQLQAKNLAEYMAARGQTRSNLAAQTELNRQNQLNGSLNSLNSQEAQNIADIEAKKAETANNYQESLSNAQANANLARQQADNSYANDLVQAQNGIESNYLTNVMNQNQQNLQNARTDALNQLSRQDSLNQQDFQNNFNMSQFDYQKQKDANDQAFKQAQADIQNKLAERQITNQEAQQAIDNAYKEKVYNDSRVDAEWEKGFKNRTLDNQISQADYDRAYKYSALQAAQNKATGRNTSTGMPTVKDYYNDLYQMQNATIKDAYGNTSRRYSDDDLINRINSLPVDGTYKAYLANSLGLQKPESDIYTESINPYYDAGGYTKYSGGR